MKRKEMHKYILISLLLFSPGCASIEWIFEDDGPQFIYPATAEEQAIVDEIETRVPAAEEKFGLRAYRSPRIVLVRSADQIVRPHWGSIREIKWKDLRIPNVDGEEVEPRFPGEGYGGLWVMPGIYLSRFGHRESLAAFKSLYGHERAHTFGISKHGIEL